jgi:hypothetical protein
LPHLHREQGLGSFRHICAGTGLMYSAIITRGTQNITGAVSHEHRSIIPTSKCMKSGLGLSSPPCLCWPRTEQLGVPPRAHTVRWTHGPDSRRIGTQSDRRRAH